MELAARRTRNINGTREFVSSDGTRLRRLIAILSRMASPFGRSIDLRRETLKGTLNDPR
jgi:hypothetical protein